MVRLKEVRNLFHAVLLFNFNSNMVRLKVYPILSILLYLLPFQFQYGSIKRQAKTYRLFLRIIISIPIWFD